MYVIEVNPRSARTVPSISKVTGIPIVDIAVEAILGKKITELGYQPGLQPPAGYAAVKMPVFSFEKIRGAEISLGPEMKSTGECLGIAKTVRCKCLSDAGKAVSVRFKVNCNCTGFCGVI